MGTPDTDRAVAYLLVRLTVGASLFGHGLVRMPKLAAFHAQVMGEFTKSMLPAVGVSACSYALPFAELIIGALLLAGALTRVAALVGAVAFPGHNRYFVDRLFAGRRSIDA